MADQTVALTEQHRQAQLTIRQQAIRDFARLWPLWNGDEQSFAQLAAAAVVLVRAYRQISAAAAAAYYTAFRQAAQQQGVATPAVIAAISDAQVATSMYVTGRDGLRAALKSGQLPAEARATTLVRPSGTIARHVLDAGRQTLIESVQNDKQAVGWTRITDGNPCYFCLTLAARGAVYKTKQTASFQAHDHCACTVMPVYKGSVIPNLQRWRNIYDAAQNEGEASGLLQPGENSSKARLNAVRRHLEHA